MLCIYRLNGNEPRPQASSPDRLRQRIGPLWKLMHVVEPRPVALEVLVLRDEKSERFPLDGPFTETKS